MCFFKTILHVRSVHIFCEYYCTGFWTRIERRKLYGLWKALENERYVIEICFDLAENETIEAELLFTLAILMKVVTHVGKNFDLTAKLARIGGKLRLCMSELDEE